MRLRSKRQRRRDRAAKTNHHAPRTTPVARQRWEVKCGGKWFRAWGGQRPRVGGYHASPWRNFGQITEVREAKRRA